MLGDVQRGHVDIVADVFIMSGTAIDHFDWTLPVLFVAALVDAHNFLLQKGHHLNLSTS